MVALIQATVRRIVETQLAAVVPLDTADPTAGIATTVRQEVLASLRSGGGGRPGRDDGPGSETSRMAEAARTAVNLLSELVSDFPENTAYRRWLARAFRARSDVRFFLLGITTRPQPFCSPL